MSGEFDGKVAIVSGAASGIGRIILRGLGEAGARTVIADVDGERSAMVLREATQAGHDVLTPPAGE